MTFAIHCLNEIVSRKFTKNQEMPNLKVDGSLLVD